MNESNKIAAVIPALNEAGAIGPTLQKLPKTIDFLIVVDGGSKDSTVAEAHQNGAEVIIEHRRGYGQACATGAARAKALGADIVLFLDGDGADAGEEADQLIEPLLQNTADFVLASRTLGKRDPGSMGLHQVLAGHLIGLAVGALSGTRYTDMCAFRALRLDTLEALGMQEMTYGWNLEMQMRAARAGLRIREIPLPYHNRIAGQSKVAGNLRGTIRAGTKIITTLARLAVATRRS